MSDNPEANEQATGGNAGGSSPNLSSIQKELSAVPGIALRVITNPVAFFREMPKRGGLQGPMVFIVAMAVATGLVLTLFQIITFHIGTAFWLLLLSATVIPICVAVGVLIGGFVVFFIWKLMGSREEYEVGFRCCCYIGAVMPFCALFNIVPYLGPIVGAAWWAFLFVVASTEVHRLKKKKAWIVFGILAAISAIASINAHRAQEFTDSRDQWKKDLSEMSPEEAGRAVGEFFKGMQEAQEKDGE